MTVVINGTTGITAPAETIATTLGVGGATPAASGAGITFPATQSASTDANTLDDYEEGTWTPTVRGSTTAGTYTYSPTGGYGRYTKVGNLVTITCYLSSITVGSAGSGYFQITGIPFEKAANTYSAGAVVTNSLVYGGSAVGLVIEPITYANATTTFYLRGIATNYTGIDIAIPTSGTPSIGFTMTYQAT